MLNMAEIANIVGIAPLTGSERGYTSGVLLPSIPFVRGTGEGSFPLSGTPDITSRDMLPYGLLARTTGSELRECSGLLYIVAHGVASDIVLTSYQTVHLLPNEPAWRASIRPIYQLDAPQPKTSAEVYSLPIQVVRLREISGLTVEHLASIFAVSRTTYHKWLDGSPLKDRHKEHLLEVLPLVEDALQRLGSSSDLNTWLLTPVSPGGKKPIDYLAEREYTTFRGFLLRVHTGREIFRPLTPSNRIYKERSPEEFKDALERLRPGAWRDDDDVSDTDDEEV